MGMYNKRQGVPKEVSAYMAKLGRKSRGGGRPLRPESELSPAQIKRRRRYLADKAKRQICKVENNAHNESYIQNEQRQ